MQFSPSCAIRRSTQGHRLTADLRGSGRRPSAKWFLRFSILLGVFFISTAIFAIKGQAAIQDDIQDASSQHVMSRSLLSVADDDNSTQNTVPAYERCDFEEAYFPYAWVVLYAVWVLIFFIALAIICDDFFVPSLEVISEKLDLSEDVAGATFMAAGSSAPELFTSVVGVAWDSDVGVGTIVGSAVFNILIIIALTAALAGQVLHLDFRPLVRDSAFYAMSIVCFIIFSWDGKFEIWEAVLLLVLYFFYILLMKFNSNLMNLKCWARSSVGPVPLDEEASAADATEEISQNTGTLGFTNVGPPRHLPPIDKTLKGSQTGVPGEHSKHVFQHVKHGELSSKFSLSSSSQHQHHPDGPQHHQSGSHHHVPHHHHGNEHGVWYLFVVKGHPATTGTKRHSVAPDSDQMTHLGDKTSNGDIIKVEEEGDDEEEELTLRPIPCLPAINMYYPESDIMGETCGCFKLFLKWVLFIVSFPFVCMFTWTIPNCGNDKYRKWYIASFVLSVTWIAAISFGMVTLVIRAGCILRVNHYTMGLVIVAVGTSVPDALSSILVARDGFGDMAVSNAIGSNVFDINLGIGLPFLIKSLIKGGAPIYLLNEDAMALLESGAMVITPHAKFGFLLLLILIFTLIIFCCVRFRLNKIVGVTFVCMYFMFVGYAFIQEFLCDYSC